MAALSGASRLLSQLAPAAGPEAAASLTEGAEDDDDTTTTSGTPKKRRLTLPLRTVAGRGSARPGDGAPPQRGARGLSGTPVPGSREGGAPAWEAMTHLRRGSGDAHMVDISGKKPSVRGEPG